MLVCASMCAPSVPRRLWWFGALLVAVQRPVVAGSRRSPGRRRVGKRGPRSRDGAAVTERTSAQGVFRRHNAWVLLKESTLRAAEAVVVRCPFGCRPEPGGPWVPAFAGKTGGRKAGAQEARRCRGYGKGLAAAGCPPARCLSAREKTAPSVLRRPWRFDALLIAVQSPVVPGSRRSPGRRGVGKRGPRSRSGAAATGMDLSAVDIPPARCLGAREKPAPSVLRRLWRFDTLLVAVQSSVVPGSRRSLGRR